MNSCRSFLLIEVELIYSAASKKEENGLIESLKNLPGVKVEADGSITVNGQPVKKITINGRSYSVSAE